MIKICQRVLGLNLVNADYWRSQSIRLASSYYREDHRNRNSRFSQPKRDTISEDVEPQAQDEYDESYDRPLFEQEDPKYSRSKKHNSKKFNNTPSETVPNLLMWAQKEKIKSLYKEDPDQWPTNRLSGNFPASVATIKKILRSKWEPDDVNIHDERAKKHWRQLLNGEFELSPALKRHLLSFVPKELQQQLKESTLTNSTDDTQKINLAEKDNDQETEAKKVSIIPPKYQFIAKYDVKKVELVNQKPQYEQWIAIPDSKWKEGATYKVGDAYYHSDGTFLYRVPGLS